MRDLDEVLKLDLELPIRGKTYVVKPPSAVDGVSLMNRLGFGIMVDQDVPVSPEELEEVRRGAVVEDDEMPDFATQCLGAAYQEMKDDKLSHPEIEFAVVTAFYAWTVGKKYAEHYWETAGEPVRPAVQSQGRPPTATPTREAAESTETESATGTRPLPATEPEPTVKV